MNRLGIYQIGKIYKQSPPGKYLCKDQTFTDAYGRGACSTHGGYLINPNPQHRPERTGESRESVSDRRPVEEKNIHENTTKKPHLSEVVTRILALLGRDDFFSVPGKKVPLQWYKWQRNPLDPGYSGYGVTPGQVQDAIIHGYNKPGKPRIYGVKELKNLIKVAELIRLHWGQSFVFNRVSENITIQVGNLYSLYLAKDKFVSILVTHVNPQNKTVHVASLDFLEDSTRPIETVLVPVEMAFIYPLRENIRQVPVYDSPSWAKHQTSNILPAEAPVSPPALVLISDLATYLEFFKKLIAGEVTGAMVQHAWQDFKEAREKIKQDLSTKTKEEILRFAGYGRRLSDKKEDLISSAMNSLATGFSPSVSISYNPFEKNGFENAIEAKIHLWTDDLVQKKAVEARAAHEEGKKRAAAFNKSLTNPETLEDFRFFIQYNGRDKLSPEQLARYDSLVAEKTLSVRTQQEKQSRTVQAVNADNVRMELKKTVHSKKGHDLFVVVLLDRVAKDLYNILNIRSKKLGGYYSAFRGQGAIPGFQFTTEEAARAFMSLDTVEKEGKESNAPAKLIEQAERREDAAREDMNRDRLTNTARRARMAAGKEADLERDIVFAERLKNVAEGIQRGEIKILAKLSSATELQTLLYIFNQCRLSYLKSIQDTVSKEALTELRAEPFNEKHIQFVKFPIPFLHREAAFNVATTLERVPGFKLLANRIGKKVNEAVRKQYPYVYFSSGMDLEDVRKIVNRTGAGKEYWDSRLKEQLLEMDRVLRLGIVNLPTLRSALRELIPYLDNVSRSYPQQVKIKEMERDLVGRKIPGFFPTPYTVVDQLLNLADIGPGDSILEPSAGKGNIAEVIRQRYPNNPLQLIEYNYTLAEILRLKGFSVIHGDFLTYQEKHDKIIMNPPFENRQDIAHIKHAYSLLKPGGRLVAIMSAGAWSASGKQETLFRDWYNQVGIIAPITLESGTFKESNTMVRTVIIAADKVEGVSGIGCSHKTCSRCGGWKKKLTESISGIMDYCSPKCQAATRDFCECKCGGKYHGGRGIYGIHSEQGTNRVLCADGKFTDASGRGVCSRHGGLKSRRNCEPCETSSDANCFAVWMSVSKIRTDENRFQNRKEKYSDESVQKIVRNYDENKLDPITIWKDTVDGWFYVLSGHSRLEAHRLLGKIQIPARIFQGTEAEAIRYGKVDANRSGTAESLTEDISAFKMERDGNPSLGVSKLSQAQLKEKWGGNYYKLENFSYLNLKGKFLEILGTPAQKNFPYIENKAGWAGYLRKVYPTLTNLHENEIFDFLFSQAGMNIKKEDFFQKADYIINRLDFNPSMPLNLHGSTNRGTNARADTAPAQAQLREIDKDIEKFRLQRRKGGT